MRRKGSIATFRLNRPFVSALRIVPPFRRWSQGLLLGTVAVFAGCNQPLALQTLDDWSLNASASGEVHNRPSIRLERRRERLADLSEGKGKVRIRFLGGNLLGGNDPAPMPADKPVPIQAEARKEAQPPIPDTAISVDRKSTANAVNIQQPPTKPIKPESTSIVVATEAEKNQVIAEGWPKPDVAFFVTGQQHGYYEPCGCTGLTNQKGGMNRRDTLLTMIRDKGWDVLPLDVGNQVRRMGRQSEIKFLTTIESLKTMNYTAIALGVDDLMLSPMEIFYAFTDADPNRKNPFLSCNVTVIDKNMMEPYRIVEVNGHKIGITSVLGDEHREKILQLQNSSEFKGIQIASAAASLKEVAKSLEREKCTFRILLSHSSIEESAKLAATVPGFDLVITAGSYGEPTYKPEPIAGTKSLMIQVGAKGMYAGLVGLYSDAKTPLRYQRIALSSQFPDSERMMKSFHAYQSQLKALDLSGLGLRPLSHQSNHEFVGTEKCGECHTTALEIWKTTGHAKGTDDLINPPERGNISRHFDPECLSCHVTGWNPQGYTPYRSGFISIEKTPHMMQNGCENCHGPGSGHVEAEDGDDRALQEKFREEMRLPLDRARDKCLECHDIDNSPDFHADGAFEEYWEKVKHVGKY